MGNIGSRQQFDEYSYILLLRKVEAVDADAERRMENARIMEWNTVQRVRNNNSLDLCKYSHKMVYCS